MSEPTPAGSSLTDDELLAEIERRLQERLNAEVLGQGQDDVNRLAERIGARISPFVAHDNWLKWRA